MSVSFHTEGHMFVLRIDTRKHPFIYTAWKMRDLCVCFGWVKKTQIANAVLARAIAKLLIGLTSFPKPDPMPEFPEMPDASPPIH